MAGPMAAQWGQQPTDNLSTLVDPDLNEVIGILHQRFQNQHIYTTIGDIILSVNPQQTIPLYGSRVGDFYKDVPSALSQQPHIFTTACRAHRYLQIHNTDQAIVLSGENGSGKTEAVKILVSQFGRLSTVGSQDPPQSDVASLLNEAMSLLEEFGNADVGINRNSSRHGKMVELAWDDGKLVGAEIMVLGLEKNRVMFSEHGEKNFHVFYRMLVGFDQEMRTRHRHNQSYRIIEPIDGGQIYRDMADAEDNEVKYRYLREYLNTLGIEHQTFRSGRQTAGTAIFEVLSALLHLGNIHFAPDPESDSAFVANQVEVEAAAELLGVQAQDISGMLLTRYGYSGGQRVMYRRDTSGASLTRNSFVRHIYFQLFDWLVKTINKRLAPTGQYRHNSKQLKTVGILDLPGFDNLMTNSLEQLHFNLAEERLQDHVTELVFRREFHDLQTDGIKVPDTKFRDNSEVLDAFYDSNIGLLRLIDENTDPSPNADMDLLNDIKRRHSKKSSVVKTDNTGQTFMVIHHRGQVIYNIEVLLTKNRPVRVRSFDALMEYSQNPLLHELMSTPHDGSSHSRHPGDTSDDLTLTQTYAAALRGMFRRLEGRETQHVWCIRPNMTLEPGVFDVDVVARQLTAMNVVEAARIRSMGYPVRISTRDFIDRYRFVGLPLSAHIDSPQGACHRVIRKAGIPDGGWQVRQRKVMLAWWHQDYLDTALERALRHVIFVQSRLRGYVARRKFYRMRRYFREDRDVLSNFLDDVSSHGLRTYHACQAQNDHNTREIERQYTGRDGGRRQARHHSDRSERDSYYSRSGYRGQSEVYNGHIDQTLDDFTTFKQTVLHDVTTKRDLDPTTWCKVICMEYDRPVGKFYVQNRDVHIDGTYDPFDGDRIGIGVFRNPERSRKTETIRAYLGQGLVLHHDTEGNIWAKRLSNNDVIVQGYDDPGNHSLSGDVILNKGSLPHGHSMKVFDMKELRSRIGLELKSHTFNRARLRHQTIVCFSLLEEEKTILDTPCWLCVVNINALNALETPDVLSQVEKMMAQAELRTEDEDLKDEKSHDAKARHLRTQWSRTDQREGFTQGESSRKLRIALRKRGEDIKNHMDYSWNTDRRGSSSQKQMTVDSLQDQVLRDPDGGLDGRRSGPTSPIGTGKTREWAKVKVTVKTSMAKEESEMDAMMKSRMSRY
ncbi:unconventional myosin-Id-like [Haliotis cracherodii]|uniref:unconventional myosin-Id-like n=1 Tax=Haliotis cracherodii TaxID=6455 RepID=UPI0039E98E66